jgi:hypothetical protein
MANDIIARRLVLVTCMTIVNERAHSHVHIEITQLLLCNKKKRKEKNNMSPLVRFTIAMCSVC